MAQEHTLLSDTGSHYSQRVKRHAEFITPPNYIKQKVGSGGLSNDILAQAQDLVKEFTDDFVIDAREELNIMGEQIKSAFIKPVAKRTDDDIERILYAAFQLRSNGAVFNYELITTISDKLVKFLEVIERLDNKALEIASVFHATLNLVFKARMKGDGGAKGKALVGALDAVCHKYFKRK